MMSYIRGVCDCCVGKPFLYSAYRIFKPFYYKLNLRWESCRLLNLRLIAPVEKRSSQSSTSSFNQYLWVKIIIKIDVLLVLNPIGLCKILLTFISFPRAVTDNSLTCN